nr:hypothetical protein [Tanacetum cinerariifolium]
KIGMIESKHKLRVDQEDLETVFVNCIAKKANLLGANESLKLMSEVLALCEKRDEFESILRCVNVLRDDEEGKNHASFVR